MKRKAFTDNNIFILLSADIKLDDPNKKLVSIAIMNISDILW